VLVLIFVSRGGTRRPVSYGDAFELWDGVRMVAEFPMTLLMDVLMGHVAGIELADRVRTRMPPRRTPLTPAESRRREARRLARKTRRAS
jgi:CheY-like chemotaxis protein